MGRSHRARTLPGQTGPIAAIPAVDTGPPDRGNRTRRADDGHTKLLIDPGHNQTRLGGPDAPLLPAESIPRVVDVLEAQAGAPGLQFLDRHGEAVPW